MILFEVFIVNKNLISKEPHQFKNGKLNYFCHLVRLFTPLYLKKSPLHFLLILNCLY